MIDAPLDGSLPHIRLLTNRGIHKDDVGLAVPILACRNARSVISHTNIACPVIARLANDGVKEWVTGQPVPELLGSTVVNSPVLDNKFAVPAISIRDCCGATCTTFSRVVILSVTFHASGADRPVSIVADALPVAIDHSSGAGAFLSVPKRRRTAPSSPCSLRCCSRQQRQQNQHGCSLFHSGHIKLIIEIHLAYRYFGEPKGDRTAAHSLNLIDCDHNSRARGIRIR